MTRSTCRPVASQWGTLPPSPFGPGQREVLATYDAVVRSLRGELMLAAAAGRTDAAVDLALQLDSATSIRAPLLAFHTSRPAPRPS